MMEYFLNEYDEYNFDPAATIMSRPGNELRSKEEVRLNTNRPNSARGQSNLSFAISDNNSKRAR